MINRASLYNAKFPDRPNILWDKGWLTGTWAIGACYANPNKLYGAYPYGYLKRVHSMFPDARDILHVFSGGLTVDIASQEAGTTQDNTRIELVDCCGPDEGRHPTWQGDVMAMPESWTGRFDLILADPPYSAADAKIYNVKMPNIRKVVKELRRAAQPGASMVWLDTCWPMHRKDQWKTYGHIGLVRSTNHRMRLVTFFEAV